MLSLTSIAKDILTSQRISSAHCLKKQDFATWLAVIAIEEASGSWGEVRSVRFKCFPLLQPPDWCQVPSIGEFRRDHVL